MVDKLYQRVQTSTGGQKQLYQNHSKNNTKQVGNNGVENKARKDGGSGEKDVRERQLHKDRITSQEANQRQMRSADKDKKDTNKINTDLPRQQQVQTPQQQHTKSFNMPGQVKSILPKNLEDSRSRGSPSPKPRSQQTYKDNLQHQYTHGINVFKSKARETSQQRSSHNFNAKDQNNVSNYNSQSSHLTHSTAAAGNTIDEPINIQTLHYNQQQQQTQYNNNSYYNNNSSQKLNDYMQADTEEITDKNRDYYHEQYERQDFSDQLRILRGSFPPTPMNAKESDEFRHLTLKELQILLEKEKELHKLSMEVELMKQQQLLQQVVEDNQIKATIVISSDEFLEEGDDHNNYNDNQSPRNILQYQQKLEQQQNMIDKQQSSHQSNDNSLEDNNSKVNDDQNDLNDDEDLDKNQNQSDSDDNNQNKMDQYLQQYIQEDDVKNDHIDQFHSQNDVDQQIYEDQNDHDDSQHQQLIENDHIEDHDDLQNSGIQDHQFHQQDYQTRNHVQQNKRQSLPLEEEIDKHLEEEDKVNRILQTLQNSLIKPQESLNNSQIQQNSPHQQQIEQQLANQVQQQLDDNSAIHNLSSILHDENTLAIIDPNDEQQDLRCLQSDIAREDQENNFLSVGGNHNQNDQSGADYQSNNNDEDEPIPRPMSVLDQRFGSNNNQMLVLSQAPVLLEVSSSKQIQVVDEDQLASLEGIEVRLQSDDSQIVDDQVVQIQEDSVVIDMPLQMRKTFIGDGINVSHQDLQEEEDHNSQPVNIQIKVNVQQIQPTQDGQNLGVPKQDVFQVRKKSKQSDQSKLTESVNKQTVVKNDSSQVQKDINQGSPQTTQKELKETQAPSQKLAPQVNIDSIEIGSIIDVSIKQKTSTFQNQSSLLTEDNFDERFMYKVNTMSTTNFQEWKQQNDQLEKPQPQKTVTSSLQPIGMLQPVDKELIALISQFINEKSSLKNGAKTDFMVDLQHYIRHYDQMSPTKYKSQNKKKIGLNRDHENQIASRERQRDSSLTKKTQIFSARGQSRQLKESLNYNSGSANNDSDKQYYSNYLRKQQTKISTLEQQQHSSILQTKRTSPIRSQSRAERQHLSMASQDSFSRISSNGMNRSNSRKSRLGQQQTQNSGLNSRLGTSIKTQIQKQLVHPTTNTLSNQVIQFNKQGSVKQQQKAKTSTILNKSIDESMLRKKSIEIRTEYEMALEQMSQFVIESFRNTQNPQSEDFNIGTAFVLLLSIADQSLQLTNDRTNLCNKDWEFLRKYLSNSSLGFTMKNLEDKIHCFEFKRQLIQNVSKYLKNVNQSKIKSPMSLVVYNFCEKAASFCKIAMQQKKRLMNKQSTGVLNEDLRNTLGTNTLYVPTQEDSIIEDNKINEAYLTYNGPSNDDLNDRSRNYNNNNDDAQDQQQQNSSGKKAVKFDQSMNIQDLQQFSYEQQNQQLLLNPSNNNKLSTTTQQNTLNNSSMMKSPMKGSANKNQSQKEENNRQYDGFKHIPKDRMDISLKLTQFIQEKSANQTHISEQDEDDSVNKVLVVQSKKLL
eukprot:403331464